MSATPECVTLTHQLEEAFVGRNDEALYDLCEEDEGRLPAKAVGKCEPDKVEQERARRLKFLEVRHPGEFEE